MQIRAAVSGDQEAVIALLGSVDALHREALPGIFRDVAGPARAQAWLAERIEDEQAALLVAEEQGELLGLVDVEDTAAPGLPLFRPRRYAVVDQLVVQDGRQGRGVGRALMDAAHEWARGRGLSEVQVNVYEFNVQARGFYEALGYVTLSRKLTKPLD